MSDHLWNALLDVPAYPPEHYGQLADRIGALLGTGNDVLLVQAEAVVALEAVAASLARPGLKVLNIVTSPYGAWFGGWLRRGGATVHPLLAAPGLPVTVQAVSEVLEAMPGIDVLALVHAESATGILNPMEEIVALARSRNIVTVVDAVASVGGHALDVDALGIDIAVIGPQKALAGPAGVSALTVSSRAWELLLHDGAPVDSVLSLVDLKRNWLDKGRGALPGTPSPLEFYALDAALDRVEAEGLAPMLARHALAAAATRDGLRALGGALWVDAPEASNLVTAALLPDGIDGAAVLEAAAAYGVELTAGVGDAAGRIVRLNHTGQRACFDAVLANVVAYGKALQAAGVSVSPAAATEAVTARYSMNTRTDAARPAASITVRVE